MRKENLGLKEAENSLLRVLGESWEGGRWMLSMSFRKDGILGYYLGIWDSRWSIVVSHSAEHKREFLSRSPRLRFNSEWQMETKTVSLYFSSCAALTFQLTDVFCTVWYYQNYLAEPQKKGVGGRKDGREGGKRKEREKKIKYYRWWGTTMSKVFLRSIHYHYWVVLCCSWGL